MTTDKRAKGPDKLEAPFPLPYISRRALARVTDHQEPPTSCGFCNREVTLVSNQEIYGREYGKWPYAYLCQGCGASVGLHPNTDLPLGTLADAETKKARKDGKYWFMRWLKFRMKHYDKSQYPAQRRFCYAKLAEEMGIPLEECHWALFSLPRARMAGSVSRRLCQAEIFNRSF